MSLRRVSDTSLWRERQAAAQAGHNNPLEETLGGVQNENIIHIEVEIPEGVNPGNISPMTQDQK